MTDITRQLVAARHMAGLSQKQLSNAAGVSMAALANIENGRSSPRLNTWSSIRDALRRHGVAISDDGRSVCQIPPAS